MMKIISHRANLDGPDKNLENHPDQISRVLSLGFDVEIDAHFLDGRWFLGHDEPQYEVSSSFFTSKMWIHCKNLEAVSEMTRIGNDLNFFWHESDKLTLTSQRVPWCYPGNFMKAGVTVFLERPPAPQEKLLFDCFGICTDFAIDWQGFAK